MGSVRQWHWVSSAVCLAGLLLFAITGITLNHAGLLEGHIRTVTVEAPLPSEVADALNEYLAGDFDNAKERAELPNVVSQFIHTSSGERLSRHIRQAQVTDIDIYMSLPRAGGDAWLVIDADAAELLYERTDRGFIAYLNDLHKGRHTGLAWSLFMDAIALSCVVFALTGLWLLIRQQRQRPLTWALTTLGLLIPVLIMLLHAN
ncbi:MAG: PepSY-associated TM helix domain-containing protein [Idiomarina sp.]|nr:PepSY-associated TM helix domain-containing protein [Idiomarina sp.]